ncbi:MAG: PaaI family thioesterase [Pseudorhodoferax sp.]
MTAGGADPAEALQALGWKPRELPGFAARFGPLWTRQEAQGWAYGVLAQQEHLNPAGAVHGGALTALLDHALSAIAWQCLDRRPCVTVQLDAQFLNPAAAGDFLVARGQLVQATASLAFLRGQVSVDDRLVVQGSAVMKIQGPRR